MSEVAYLTSDSDNPLNAASNITQVCTKCGRKFPATVEYFQKLKVRTPRISGECDYGLFV